MRILRRILIIALAVYAVLSASHGIYRGFGDLNYNLFIYRVDDNFRKYKKDFETLTKMVSKRFEDDFNGMDDLSSVHIDCTSDKIYYTYIYKDGRGSDIFEEAADADTAACFDSMRKNVFTQHSDNRIGFTDIRRISEAVKETGALFHTDAVQAVGHIPVDFKKIGADMMSFSAHKFHGPKGVGALICRRGVPVSPFILGGAQESSRRAGTENVAGIVGMAAALRESVQTLEADAKYVAGLRDELLSGLAEISGFSSNAECSLPGILSVRFAGADGEAIVRSLDLFGIAASAGAACNSTEVKASPVLLAMGLSEKDAASAVRFSLDRTNTMDDVRAIVSAMKRILSFA